MGIEFKEYNIRDLLPQESNATPEQKQKISKAVKRANKRLQKKMKIIALKETLAFRNGKNFR